MALYFFDIDDGALHRDDTGIECADLATMRREVKRALPAMARDILPADGNLRTLTVVVRDEKNATVYAAALMSNGSPCL